jgi:hypothetical protein
MSVARQYQQPRSIVLGRPLPAPGEPLWLPEDLEWAIAYERRLASICGGCGTRREDWEGLGPEDPEPFVSITDRCPGCYEIALGDKDIPEDERSLGARSVLLPGSVYDRRVEIVEAAERLGMKKPRFT